MTATPHPTIDDDPAAGAAGRLAAAVGEIRRGLAAGGRCGPERLAALAGAAADLPRGPGRGRAAWLALGDELTWLVAELEQERDALARQLARLARHRRAGSAYHRTDDRP